MTDPPEPAEIRLECCLDRVRISHHRRLQGHLALVVHHANRRLVHADVQSGEEFHRSPPALLNARSLRRHCIAGHHTASPNPQPRPITGGLLVLRFVERGVCVVTGRRNSLAPAFWGRRHGPVKAALEASVRYLAHELGPKRIRANAISAGAVATRAASGIEHFDGLLNENVRKAPLHRTVDSCEVGRAALLLATGCPTGITRKVVHVDAGFLIQGMVFH